jgi:hypothetical protein
MKPGSRSNIGRDFKSGHQVGPRNAQMWRPRSSFLWNYHVTSKFGYAENEGKTPVQTIREWEPSDQKTDEELPTEEKMTYPAPKIVTVDGSAVSYQTENEEKSAMHIVEGHHVRIENKLQKKVYSIEAGVIEIYGSTE